MKQFAKRISALVLVFVLSLAALAPAASAAASLPALPSGQCVVDDAGVLSSSTVQTITDLNAQLQANCKGATIGVLTVRRVVGVQVGTLCCAVLIGRTIAAFNHFFRAPLLRAAGLDAENGKDGR